LRTFYAPFGLYKSVLDTMCKRVGGKILMFDEIRIKYHRNTEKMFKAFLQSSFPNYCVKIIGVIRETTDVT